MPLPLLSALGVVVALALSCDGAVPTLPPPGPRAAAITVLTTPAGAAVTVNGIPVGPSPVTVSLNPGPARLRATLSGYYPAPETPIVVEGGVAATHTLSLVASH
jgi:hypothetical protein